MTNANKENGSPTDARKRRKEILAASKLVQHEKRQKIADEKAKTKYQNRYVPDVAMTKEQEAEWRREARRKRNRESAAASRNKVRSRISELEEEVDEWKKRYSMLLERIDALEKIHNSGGSLSIKNEEYNRQFSGDFPQVSYLKPSTSALNLALNVPLNLDGPHALNDVDLQETIPESSSFHVIEMNSRPA